MAPVNFDKYEQKANQFLDEIAGALGEIMGMEGDHEKASKAFRTVAHTIRKQITHEESIQLIAQFPMYLKAVYVDGWSSSEQKEKVNHLNEFYDLMIDYANRQKFMEIQTREDAEKLAQIVLKVLKNHISKGELQDIQAILPQELKPLFSVKAA